MEWAGLAAQLALAAVFATAGGLKLRERRDMARSLAEVVLAIALLVPGVGRWAAAAAALILLAYTGNLLAARARGRDDDCDCFGAAHPVPAGRAIARNAVLVIVAVVATVA
jgi:hypothetical protein